jgi:hypothetical protein
VRGYAPVRGHHLTGIPVDVIDWTTLWYLREETLRPADASIVNAHHRHPLVGAWGGGTLSSSDGLRLPMRGKSLTGRVLSRYFVNEGAHQLHPRLGPALHLGDPDHRLHRTRRHLHPSTRSSATPPSCPSPSTRPSRKGLPPTEAP